MSTITACGGELSGGRAGWGTENKVPFVAAVSLNEMGHPVIPKIALRAGLTVDAVGVRMEDISLSGRPSSCL